MPAFTRMVQSPRSTDTDLKREAIRRLANVFPEMGRRSGWVFTAFDVTIGRNATPGNASCIVFEVPNDFRTTQRDDVFVADRVGIDSSWITCRF